jgi:hypothetical protein
MRGKLEDSPHRWLIFAGLLLITVLAAFLRFWQLDRIPPGFHYDEAYEALEAGRVLTQPGYHPIFFPGNFGVEPMFIYLTSLAFRLFGASPEVMRGVAALIGTLTVPALYALARELARADERMPAALPLLAAAALAIMRWHVFFSRVGIEPVLVPFLLTLMLWAFWRALRTNGLGAWIAFGAMAGLGAYTYPAGRLLPVIALGLGLWALAQRRRGAGEQGSRGAEVQGCRGAGEQGSRGAKAPRSSAPPFLRPSAPLLLAGIVALAVMAPLALSWLQHPDQLLLRSSQIAVGPAGAVAGTPLSNLLPTLGMFNVRGDPDPRNNLPGMPALDWLMSIPFLIGLGVTLWRWRRPAFGMLLLVGAVMLVPTIFSEYAPHFRRALGAAPIVALLCGLGLAVILGRRAGGPATRPDEVPERLRDTGVAPEELAADMDRLRWVGRVIIVAAILLGSLIYTISAYFIRWGNSQAIYYAYDQGLWEIGQYVLSLPPDEAVYITPRPATDMTLAFAWRDGRPVRHFDGRHAFVATPAGGPATYIVIDHEDFRGGGLLQQIYPGAVETKTFRDRAGQVYARAFRVDAEAQPARQPEFPTEGSWPGIDLIGYDLDRAEYRPGDVVYLQLWWRATNKPTTDWTVFTHLLGPAKADGSILWTGRDARPGDGSAPTTAWAPGDLILDEYQLQLPADTPPGDYAIEVGLYDPAAGGARAIMTSPTGQDHLILGTVRVR